MLIAHVTDPHIGLDTRRLSGHPGPAEALRRALARAAALAPEVLLLTGDLTDSGAEHDYQTLRDVLAQTLRAPDQGGPQVWAIPGNHDHRATAQQVLGTLLAPAADAPAGLTCKHHTLGGLHFIGLDTLVAGEPHGELGDAQLEWLARTLATCAGQPVLIFMHHSPLVSGLVAMDACGLLRGKERLAQLVRQHGGVQLIAAGHLHRPTLGALGGAPVVVAPSSSHQLDLNLDPDAGLAARMEPPQIGLYRWTAQDGMTCHFTQVNDYPGPFAV